jgi:hypothetical protein
MIKNYNFNVSSEEKSKILSLHESATKNHYLTTEQKCSKGGYGCHGTSSTMTGAGILKKGSGVGLGDEGVGNGLVNIDPSQLESEWTGMTNPERTPGLKSAEGQKQLNLFKSNHPSEPETFFYALFRDADRVNSFNTTGNYDKYFGPDGKTLLMMKNDGGYKFLGWIRGLCNIFNGKDSSPWIIYYRMIFGKRTDLTAEELYNHFKTINNMKQIVESGYNRNEIIKNNKIDCSL